MCTSRMLAQQAYEPLVCSSWHDLDSYFVASTASIQEASTYSQWQSFATRSALGLGVDAKSSFQFTLQNAPRLPFEVEHSLQIPVLCV